LDSLEDRCLPSRIGLTVNSLADSGAGSLRAAITAADTGSPSDKFTISFSVTGTIDLQTPLPDLNNSIAIQGPGAGSLTIMRDSAVLFTSPILAVDAGQTAGLSGLTIANGDNLLVPGSGGGNGGGIVNFGALTVSDCTLYRNTTGHDGGGIWNAGTLTVSNSTFTGNTAPGDGGGAILNDGLLTVTASLFSGNSAVVGGGIYNNVFGLATINQCTLSGNTASSGGAIDNGGPLTVRGCTVTGNSATGFDFGGHHFAGKGGGLFNGGGTLTTIRDSVLSGNSAELGGAIYSNVSYETLNVRGSIFCGNSASDSGGAVYNRGGTATLQDCTLFSNSAGSAGGGIFNDVFGTLMIDDSSVSGNNAPLGADLYNLGTATLHDSAVGVIAP
jgi:hypothetical protein